MSEDQELKTAIVQDINSKILNPATAGPAGAGILMTILPEMPLDVLQAIQTNVDNMIAQSQGGG